MTDNVARALDLETAANAMLRCDRTYCQPPAMPIDLLSRRDAMRRDRRRRAIVMQNLSVVDILMCQSKSPEEELIRKEEEQRASALIDRILAKFEQDRTVRAVILVVLQNDISFAKTKEIARACSIRENIVRAAKERLKYHVRTSESLLQAA